MKSKVRQRILDLIEILRRVKQRLNLSSSTIASDLVEVRNEIGREMAAERGVSFTTINDSYLRVISADELDQLILSWLVGGNHANLCTQLEGRTEATQKEGQALREYFEFSSGAKSRLSK